MAFQTLNRLLAKHGETDATVERCVFVKIGGLAFQTDQSSYDPTTHSAFVKKLLPDVIKAVAGHPNVSAPISVGKSDRAASTLGGPEILAIGPHSAFHVTLPRPRLKFPQWSSCGDIEDFYAVCSGSLFLAFKEVEDYPEACSIGQEIRELLDGQIEASGTVKRAHLAPVPLHPDIYMVIARPGADGRPRRPRAFQEGGDLIVIFGETTEKTLDLVDDFLLRIELPVFAFYHERLAMRSADGIAEEILTIFSTLSRNAKLIFTVPPWQFLESRRLTNEIRMGLSSVHEKLVQREAQVLALQSSRQEVLRGVADNSLLSPITDYFTRELQSLAEIPDSLSPALAYFESQLSLALNIRSLLVATVLGAAIGAILGSLFTWLVSHSGH